MPSMNPGLKNPFMLSVFSCRIWLTSLFIDGTRTSYGLYLTARVQKSWGDNTDSVGVKSQQSLLRSIPWWYAVWTSQVSQKLLCFDRLVSWMGGRLIEWLVNWLINWLNNWLNGRLIGWLIYYLIDWLIDWLKLRTPSIHENFFISNYRRVSYERYADGRVIAYQNRDPDRFYFIISGRLSLLSEYQLNTGTVTRVIGEMKKGQHSDVSTNSSLIECKKTMENA